MNKKINSELIGINDIYFLKCFCTELKDKLEAYENMRKEAINKLKEHKKDLDYEPWSLYEVRGSILFNLSNILNKVGEDNEKN